jgi:hypothetical protein
MADWHGWQGDRLPHRPTAHFVILSKDYFRSVRVEMMSIFSSIPAESKIASNGRHIAEQDECRESLAEGNLAAPG